MEMLILAFWAVVFAVLFALRHSPDSALARAAFTWLGPLPSSGESWAKFQFRWAVYSFSWLCQFCFALTVLVLLGNYVQSIGSSTWFQVFFFALPFGAGIALFALVGFLFKAAKARFFGPNPKWAQPQEESHVA